MASDFRKQFLRNLIVPLGLLAAGILVVAVGPRGSSVVTLAAIFPPVIAAVAYVFLAHRQSQAYQGQERDFLILGSVMVVLLFCIIIYPVTAYWMTRNPDGDDGNHFRYHWPHSRLPSPAAARQPTDPRRAAAAAREFLDRLGYLCGETPVVTGRVVGFGLIDDNLDSNLVGHPLSFAWLEVDPAGSEVREFVYQKSLNIGPTGAVPRTPDQMRTAATRLAERCGLPRAAIPLTAPELESDRELLLDQSDAFFFQPQTIGPTTQYCWYRQANGLPCFFDRVVLEFDAEGFLVHYRKTWSDLAPIPGAVTVTEEAAIRTARQTVETDLVERGAGGESGLAVEIRAVRAGRFNIQPVRENEWQLVRSGDLRPGWVVRCQTGGKMWASVNYEYVLIDGATGAVIGHFDEERRGWL